MFAEEGVHTCISYYLLFDTQTKLFINSFIPSAKAILVACEQALQGSLVAGCQTAPESLLTGYRTG